MDSLPTLADVRAARERIKPYIRATPIIRDGDETFKFEFLQYTGSFKVRGAFNAALQLDAQERDRGIVAVSGGNHGLAVAYVGQALGIPVTLCMPKTTPAYVTEQTSGLGAQVRLGETIAAAFAECDRLAAQGLTLLHPFDNADVIAGGGTIGFEILEDYPQVERVVISIGGGGLLGGIAAVIKEQRPDVEVIGVETRGADAMHQALAAGHIVTLPAITSIARTLGAPAVSERTLAATRAFVDNAVVVDDRDAVAAIIELQERLGLTLEPAAACTLAALRTGAIPPAAHTLFLLCGRNVRLEEIAQWTARFVTPASLAS
jgi:threonine dehydratase